MRIMSIGIGRGEGKSSVALRDGYVGSGFEVQWIGAGAGAEFFYAV